MVLQVKKDQHGAFVYVIEPKYPDDPELDFEKKLIHVRNGNDSIKLWLGALQDLQVINSLAGSIKKHQLGHRVDMEGNTQDVLFNLLTVCETNNILFNAVVQILLDVKLRRISYVDSMVETDNESIDRALLTGGAVRLDEIDFRLEPREGFTHVAVTGMCNELFTPANKTLLEEEVLLAIEDIDLRQSTNILSLVDTDNIALDKHHLQVDKVDGTTLFTVYVPLFPHSQPALWNGGQCYGPRRAAFPSEKHGYNEKHYTLGSVEGKSTRPTSNTAKPSGEPDCRRKEYTYTLVFGIPHGYELAGEMRGATWMDISVVVEQTIQWLAALGNPAAHVIVRTLRMKSQKKGRYISYPIVTIYLPTGAQCSRLQTLVGLAGRTPATKSPNSGGKAEPSWTLVVATRGLPIIIKDFMFVPINLGYRQLIMAKTMLELSHAKATDRMQRITGVQIGPLSNVNRAKLCNILRIAVDLIHGLSPRCIFLAPTISVQGNYDSGSCELIIIQDEAFPLPTEISQITAVIEEFAYYPSFGIAAVPFAGTYRGDSSLYKATMGSTEVDGAVFILPANFHKFRHHTSGLGPSYSPTLSTPADDGETIQSDILGTKGFSKSSQSFTQGKCDSRSQSQGGSRGSFDILRSGQTTSSAHQAGSDQGHPNVVAAVLPIVRSGPKDVVLPPVQQSTGSGPSGGVRPPSNDSNQEPPAGMDTDLPNSERSSSTAMDEDDAQSDDDFLSALQQAMDTDGGGDTVTPTGGTKQPLPDATDVSGSKDSPLKRIRANGINLPQVSSTAAPGANSCTAGKGNVG